jgi:hypothetical protein
LVLQFLRSFIMKSSKFTLATLAFMLAIGTAAYAKGPMNGQAGGNSVGAAAGATGQSRTGNPGVGTATRTQTQSSTKLQAEAQIRARLHAMSPDGVSGARAGTGAAAGSGAPRGIHTPGTGLTSTTDGAAAVAQ